MDLGYYSGHRGAASPRWVLIEPPSSRATLIEREAMSIHQKREELKKVYPNSDTWAGRVDKMSEPQVTAIFIKFQSEGRLGR